MTDDNLPPGTTADDIDKHYAPPRIDQVMGVVEVVADAEVPEYFDDVEARRELISEVRRALKGTRFDTADAEVQERWEKME